MKFNYGTILPLLACSTVFASDSSNRNLKSKKGSRSAQIKVPRSPPLPGVSNGRSRPKVILAQALDYPPYTSMGIDLGISGFGPDFARGLEDVCEIDVILVETAWSECWGSGKIGNGLLSGHYHGCTTYTGTKGVRNRYLEFSSPILAMNKAAGILTRLENGVPVVNGQSSLAGANIGDVVGWAPTADVLATSKNLCTGESFSGFTLVGNDPESGGENDQALAQLLNGEVDALWIYADQAATYKDACDNDSNQAWDCTMWSRFGTDFAYVQTGIYDYMNSGTTLAISKKGSGLADTLDPCIEAFIKTEAYKNLCVKYGLESDCFKNEFFDVTDDAMTPYSKPTIELTTTCSDGYCPCS
jgi:hypothetical protein